MDAEAKPHRRRVRYRGTHPRRFEEKYKEFDPQKYPETVSKVMAAGKTPAGTHRPIMVQEILSVLAPQAGEIAVDCTLGFGGHAVELLNRIRPGGRLIALDADPIECSKTETRLRSEGFEVEELIVRNTNFAALPQVLAECGIEVVDVLLADLGVSSMQLDNPARGFTFKHEGPLDLRLNPNKGRSAGEFLASISMENLAETLRDFSDEPHAELIAAAIVEARPRSIASTRALADCIRAAFGTLPRRVREQEADGPIRRTFQALRIAVNDEFGVLEHLLRVLPHCLRSGGRAAFLTFHSGEDRRVKKSFQEGHRAGLYREVADEPRRAGPEEMRANPRASSAKLRWAVRA
jgi:16S rRNA (cytosine1402-N4)-methyltransferase